MYHRYWKNERKQKAVVPARKHLDSGEIMAMMMLLLLLADGNEESESVVTTLLIFLFL